MASMKRMKTKKRARMLIKYHCKKSAEHTGIDWRLTPEYKKFLRRVHKNENRHLLCACLNDGSVKMLGTFRHAFFNNLMLV